MLSKGEKALPEDRVRPAEEIKDPFVLEFLGLKDEYSESDLEEALIGTWRPSSWSWAAISALSAGRSGCASATNGTEWTCSFPTAACDVS